MDPSSPVLVALPLDHEAPGIVATAAELTGRLQVPTIVVHALAPRRMESERGLQTRIVEARAELEPHLAPLRAAGVKIQAVSIGVGEAAEVVVETARRAAVQMIVTGGGRPATVRRWVVGSVAEEIVRRSTVPVWVARGVPLAGHPLVCPVDLSPESKVGLATAIGMARLFDVPLSLITVVSDDGSRADQAKLEAAARKQLDAMIAAADVDGLQVSASVVAGDPAEAIVDAADEAGLMVIASRGYDPLVREWLGPVTTRALRHSHCNILTIRHLAEGHTDRMEAIARLADLYTEARALLVDGESERALPLLESLAQQAPTNAVIQEAYAIALERVGRDVEATGRQALATVLRERLPRVH